MSIASAFYSNLEDGPNAVKEGEDNSEGIVGKLTPELVLERKDEELLELAKRWKLDYSAYERKIKEKQDENVDYWKGIHFDSAEYSRYDKPIQENRIFADLESFLPIATRQSPEPLVTAEGKKEIQEQADDVAKMLLFQSDRQKLKLKGKKATRHWALYFLGCAKIGWSTVENDIKTTILKPTKLILDPTAPIDEDGYHGEYLGEYREETADSMIKQFPGKKKEINDMVDKKKGTKIKFVEWWTDEIVFWTLKDSIVLDKIKNPHWNYKTKKPKITGNEPSEETQLKNHFKKPSMPYRFLSVFSVGDQPHDDANLIQQNIPTQDRLNERHRQIDRNVKEMNAGGMVSGEAFSQDQAQEAADAVRRGDWVLIPAGMPLNEAFSRYTGVALPPDVFQNVLDMRGQMDNLFGIHGTTRGERGGPETLGGRMMLKNADVDRISFISEYIEQFYDDIFNYWVQMMYVYYSDEHIATILGAGKSPESVKISRQGLNKLPELLVSVREGSMIPKDPMLKRNEAVQLYQIGAMDPITLFERLDFPNPMEAAKKLYLWNNAPQQLFPDVELPQPSDGVDAGYIDELCGGGQGGGAVGSENVSVASVNATQGA